jgi:hypothetical protein
VKPIAPVLKGQEPPSSMALPALYYEEVVIIPEGSLSEPGALMGVGPGLCKILHPNFREHPFWATR